MIPQSVSPANVVDAIKLLGIHQAILDYISRGASREHAVIRLREVLPEIKEVWRRIVLATHPDRGGDKDEFVAAQSAWELVQSDVFAHIVWDVQNHYCEPTPMLSATTVHVRAGAIRIVRDLRKYADVQFTSPYESVTASANATGFGGFSSGEPFFVKGM
jgi:hypothetical protein